MAIAFAQEGYPRDHEPALETKGTSQVRALAWPGLKWEVSLARTRLASA